MIKTKNCTIVFPLFAAMAVLDELIGNLLVLVIPLLAQCPFYEIGGAVLPVAPDVAEGTTLVIGAASWIFVNKLIVRIVAIGNNRFDTRDLATLFVAAGDSRCRWIGFFFTTITVATVLVDILSRRVESPWLSLIST